MGVYQEALRLWNQREQELRLDERARLLVHQVEHKLRRRLTDAERSLVAARLVTMTPDEINEVVLDLDGPQLARWLADPAAR